MGLCSEFLFGSACQDGGADGRAPAVHGALRVPPRAALGVCLAAAAPAVLGVSEGLRPKAHPLNDSRERETAWKSHCSLLVRVRGTSQSHAKAPAPPGTRLVKPGPGHQDVTPKCRVR